MSNHRYLFIVVLFALPVGNALAQGYISGQILVEQSLSPLPNASVRVFDALNAEIVYQTAADINGYFATGPLPSGKYKVRVDLVIVSGQLCKVVREFLGDEIPGSGGDNLHADVFDTSKIFVVDEGNTTQVTGVVAVSVGACVVPVVCVPTTSALEGVILDKETGELVNGILVKAKDPINAMPKIPDLVSGQKADGAFSWSITDTCPVGDAKLRFYDPEGRYSPEYYNDRDDTFALGDVVRLSGGTNVGKVFLSRVSPQEQLANLATQISNLPIIDQVKNTLTNPVNQAETLLDDANPNNDKAACGLIKAFINAINGGVASGTPSIDDRDALASAAQAVQLHLDCQN